MFFNAIDVEHLKQLKLIDTLNDIMLQHNIPHDSTVAVGVIACEGVYEIVEVEILNKQNVTSIPLISVKDIISHRQSNKCELISLGGIP